MIVTAPRESCAQDDAPAETPRPLHTTVIIGPYDDGEPGTAVVRMWSEDDAKMCRLCPAGRCKATPGPYGLDRDGQETRLYFCTIGVDRVVDSESAPLLALAPRL